MAVQSMTGFARAAAEHGGATVAWELRSVNGKGLEARFRLPPGFERIEARAKQAVQKKFARGTIQATLAVARAGGAVQPVVNEAFLRDVAELAQRLERQYGCRPASADGLLSLRGVLEIPEAAESEEVRAAFDDILLAVLDEALEALAQARSAEGADLAAVMLGHVDTIEALVARAEADPSRDPAVIRDRLAGQVRLILDAAPGLDEGRIAMEAALLASKADIREEIDRLRAHIAAARRLLREGGAIGRRLDFLAQEFNRESNTLCSKSNATPVTAIGLELKAAVDQFREQVQNLE